MAKLKSSSLNTRNWRGAIFRDPVPNAMELARKVAGVELTEADRALLTEAQDKARARMSGRTIDETGKDISERPQPESEPIKTGWYWTGTHVVWVIGPTANGREMHYQTAVRGFEWVPIRNAASWQRVHQAVRESMRGFNWRPPAPNH